MKEGGKGKKTEKEGGKTETHCQFFMIIFCIIPM